MPLKFESLPALSPFSGGEKVLDAASIMLQYNRSVLLMHWCSRSVYLVMLCYNRSVLCYSLMLQDIVLLMFWWAMRMFLLCSDTSQMCYLCSIATGVLHLSSGVAGMSHAFIQQICVTCGNFIGNFASCLCDVCCSVQRGKKPRRLLGNVLHSWRFTITLNDNYALKSKEIVQNPLHPASSLCKLLGLFHDVLSQ